MKGEDELECARTEAEIVQAVLEVLKPNQVMMICRQLKIIRGIRFGEVRLIQRGDRLFVTRSESYDCGKVSE